METRQLQYFIALAKTGSFSKAAQVLHITQSALSRSMQCLEDDIGGKLLDRIGRRSLLTPLGEHVLQRAHRLVQEVSNLRRSSEVLRETPHGLLKIGFGAGPGAALAVPFTRHVLENYPGMRLEIRKGLARAQLSDLKDASLDVIVADGRAYAPSDDLVIEPLAGLRGGAICRAGHPLAQMEQVTFGSLAHFPILTTAMSDEIALLMVNHFGPEADPLRFTTVQCEELETLVAVALCTDAIYLGVIAGAQESLNSGVMKVLPLLPHFEITVPVALVRLAGRTESTATTMLRTFVQTMLMK